MGSLVFYRSSDKTVLILSRDGDVITHVVGEGIITVNGEERRYDNPSFLVNNDTYISIDMISAGMCPDRVFYENQQLHIEKNIVFNEHHKIITTVLEQAKNSDFYPERFERYKNYYAKNQSLGVREAIYRVNLGLDLPFYESVSVIEHPYELLVLVNKQNQLPTGFKQYNLVEMDKKYTAQDGKEYLLASVTYEQYLKMCEAAEKDGLKIIVVSAYRTEDYQRNLYNKSVNSNGAEYADEYSARPGHSEHQTGLAVDINSVYTSFENTNEFKWLQKHAHEFGFILRYPKDKEWITGYAYEPWHYRYVGVDVANAIHHEGITYEEYYAKYINVNEFK